MSDLKISAPYPTEIAEEVARVQTDDGVAILMKNSQYVPPNHVCQFCGKRLDALDLFDYICNKCESK